MIYCDYNLNYKLCSQRSYGYWYLTERNRIFQNVHNNNNNNDNIYNDQFDFFSGVNGRISKMVNQASKPQCLHYVHFILYQTHGITSFKKIIDRFICNTVKRMMI